MPLGQSIADKLIGPDPLISVEFCPARSEEEARKMLKTAQELKAFQLDFVSITYGAGGSTRERTIEYGELLHEIFGFEAMD